MKFKHYNILIKLCDCVKKNVTKIEAVDTCDNFSTIYVLWTFTSNVPTFSEKDN